MASSASWRTPIIPSTASTATVSASICRQSTQLPGSGGSVISTAGGEARATLDRLNEAIGRLLAGLAAPLDDAACVLLRPEAVLLASDLAGALAAAGRDGEAQSLLRAAESLAGPDEHELLRAA